METALPIRGQEIADIQQSITRSEWSLRGPMMNTLAKFEVNHLSVFSKIE